MCAWCIDFAILKKTPVVSFPDMMGKEKREPKPRRSKISRDGSKQIEQSSGGESCDGSSVDGGSSGSTVDPAEMRSCGGPCLSCVVVGGGDSGHKWYRISVWR